MSQAAGTAHDVADPIGPEDPDAEDESLPEGVRRCILTRERHPRARLLRFVLDPDGQVVPDVDERLPGRGLWLSPGRDVIEMAASRRAFSRAARRPVTVPSDLADRVEALLVRRCLNILGLARRGGQVVTGFEKVRARLRERPVGVLLAASDGAADGRAKVAALAAALSRPRADADPDRSASPRSGRAWSAPTLVAAFTASELGQPLGRDRAVHVALDAGRLATGLLETCALLSGFRAEPVVDLVPATQEPDPDANPPTDRDRADG